jgi:hypothetical protein
VRSPCACRAWSLNRDRWRRAAHGVRSMLRWCEGDDRQVCSRSHGLITPAPPVSFHIIAGRSRMWPCGVDY